MTTLRLGPARYFRPVCIRWPWGFVAGPAGYVEVGPDEAHLGPLVIDPPAAEASQTTDADPAESESEAAQ